MLGEEIQVKLGHLPNFGRQFECHLYYDGQFFIKN